MRSNIEKRVMVAAIFGCAALGVVAAQEPVAPAKEDLPTRLISGDVTEHIEMLRARLAINKQEQGPFGLYQKPSKEVAKKLFVPKKRQKTVEIPFKAVIDAMRVSAVMPADKMFMVGSRELKQGQVLPLVAGGKSYEIRVERVGRDEIIFRNLADSQLVVKRLDLLPDGVTADEGILEFEGLEPTNEGANAPLEIPLLMTPARLER